MEITATSNRLHPLMAAAAVSLTLVSLVGAAAIAGLLPNSHGAAVAVPAAALANTASIALAQQSASAPVERQAFRHKTVTRRDAPPRQATNDDSDQRRQAQAEQARYDRPTPAYQQPAAVTQNSPLGIGIGALLGGLVGSHVGGGNGRTLAAIAGAVGGAYAGNEIAKHNQALGQQ